jgi:hypothetical protein
MRELIPHKIKDAIKNVPKKYPFISHFQPGSISSEFGGKKDLIEEVF